MALLGGGAFGKVYKEWFNGQLCAVKKVPEHMTTDSLMQREYEVYCTVKHENVVKLVDRIEKRGRLWYIPMELIDGQTLKEVIFHPMRRNYQLTLLLKSWIIRGMCEGLLYLHQNNIIHRDLKPDNIMVIIALYRGGIALRWFGLRRNNPDLAAVNQLTTPTCYNEMVEHVTSRPVLIDLGFAKFEYSGYYSSCFKGNLAYAAPEVVNQPFTKQNHKSDVWALGKIIAELLLEYQVASRGAAHYQTLLKEHPEYYEQVIQMLDGCPVPRPSMSDVIGQIREAQRKVGEPKRPAPVPRPSRSPQLHTVPEPASAALMDPRQHRRSSSIELPPNFRLPNPLPPNHTITVNYITRDSSGAFVKIRGEIQTRHGQLHHAIWTTCQPNALDMSSLPRD